MPTIQKKGYKPHVTPLCFEKQRVKWLLPAEIPPEAGGWNPKKSRWTPVVSYKRMGEICGQPNAVVFLDSFTAAVEAGFLDEDNWHTAFERPSNWQKLFDDMRDLDLMWLHDRHYNAFAFLNITDEEDATTYPGLAACIRFALERQLEFARDKAKALKKAKAAEPKPRAVFPEWADREKPAKKMAATKKKAAGKVVNIKAAAKKKA
jgi:hypothetical protein